VIYIYDSNKKPIIKKKNDDVEGKSRIKVRIINQLKEVYQQKNSINFFLISILKKMLLLMILEYR